MRLKSRLWKWQENNLLSEKQVADITAFEKVRFQGILQSGLKYTGLLSILLGISLVVAANWDIFGVYTRLGAHILLNGFVAFLVWHWRDLPGKNHLREGAVYILCGLTLTLLALVGQSFQLQGEISGLLLLWMALITGMVVVIGQHARIAHLWMIGFIITLCYNLAFLFDHWPPAYAFFASLTIATFLPLIFRCAGHLRPLRKLNPFFADMMQQAAMIGGVAGAALASFAFYDGHQQLSSVLQIGTSLFYLYTGIVIAASFTAFLGVYRFMRSSREDLAVLGVCATFVFIPYVLPVQGAVFAATHFITLFLALAFAAHHTQHERLLGLCLFAVSARLFIVFLELFGTMLMTGWGLIICGIFLIGLVKIMRRVYNLAVTGERGRHA